MALALVVGVRLGLLAATLGGTQETSRGEAAFGLEAGERDAGAVGWRAAGGAALTLYLDRRVVDDATPLALQPFLQRASTLRLAFAGGGYSLGPLGIDPDGQGWQVAAVARADVYLSRTFAVAARIGWSEARFRAGAGDAGPNVVVPPGATRATDIINGDVALGARFGDLRLDAGLSLAPRRDRTLLPAGPAEGGWLPSVAPGGFLRVRAVPLEHIDLVATVRAVEHGGGADVTVDYYPSRRLGLLAGIGGSRARLRPDLPAATCAAAVHCDGNELHARVGFSYWATRRFGLVALFAPRFISPTVNPSGTVDNRVTLTLATRF